jgi:glycosyltransferase involved in cell wall biosynthesis
VRILVTSRLYPSAACPSRGTFVHHQVRFLLDHCTVSVVSPTPWSLPLPGKGRWSAYGRIERAGVLDGVEVRYPRYLSPPWRLGFTSAWQRYLAALSRAVDGIPDLIHAHLAYPDGLAAVRLGRRLGRPVVISVHGHDVRELPEARPAWRRLVVQALQGAAAVIVSSADVRRRVLALGTDPARVRFVPQGVDCRLFRPSTERRPGEGGWRLLYLGRFDPNKGVGVLLAAMARLREQGRPVGLRLVGGSPMSGTGALFQRQVHDLGLAGVVEFCGELPWTRVPAEIGQADLLVLPSFYDSFGIVLIEAMACGLPVVATRCGGPEELVPPEAGELVPVADPEALAQGIARVLDRYATYDRAAIRRRIERLYDYPELAARIAGIYREVLDEFPAGSLPEQSLA